MPKYNDQFPSARDLGIALYYGLVGALIEHNTVCDNLKCKCPNYKQLADECKRAAETIINVFDSEEEEE